MLISGEGSGFRGLQAKTKIHHSPDGPVPIVGPDGVRHGVTGEVRANASLQVVVGADVARVADGVGANAERRTDRAVELRLQGRLIVEKLVFVDQLDAAG